MSHISDRRHLQARPVMTAEIVAFGQFDTKPDASGEFSPAAGAGQEM